MNRMCCDCADPLNDEEAAMYGNRCERCERAWLTRMREAADETKH